MKKDYIAHQHLEPCLTPHKGAIIICAMNELIVWCGRKYEYDLGL